MLPPNVSTYMSNKYNLNKLVASADLLIGAVLVPGSKAPVLVTREMLGRMKQGAVIVDTAVDQGGCVETMRPTTHADPLYFVDGILHCGIANLAGAVPRTATMALCNATLPYVIDIASQGWEGACQGDRTLARGLKCHPWEDYPQRGRGVGGRAVSSAALRHQALGALGDCHHCVGRARSGMNRLTENGRASNFSTCLEPVAQLVEHRTFNP